MHQRHTKRNLYQPTICVLSIDRFYLSFILLSAVVLTFSMYQPARATFRDFVRILPPELIHEIATYLTKSSLSQLCQVAKMYRDRFQPELYKFDLKNGRAAIVWASKTGNFGMLKKLIEIDRKFEERNNGESLRQAIIAGDVEYFEELLMACGKHDVDALFVKCRLVFYSLPCANRSDALCRAIPDLYTLVRYPARRRRMIRKCSVGSSVTPGFDPDLLNYEFGRIWTTSYEEFSKYRGGKTVDHRNRSGDTEHVDWVTHDIKVKRVSSVWQGMLRREWLSRTSRHDWERLDTAITISSAYLHYRWWCMFGPHGLSQNGCASYLTLYPKQEVHEEHRKSQLQFKLKCGTWEVAYLGTAKYSKIAVDLVISLIQDTLPHPRSTIPQWRSMTPDMHESLEIFSQILSDPVSLEVDEKWDYERKARLFRCFQIIFNGLPVVDRKLALEDIKLQGDERYDGATNGFGKYYINNTDETECPWPSMISPRVDLLADPYMVKGYFLARWTYFLTAPGQLLKRHVNKFRGVVEEGDATQIVVWNSTQLYVSRDSGELCLFKDSVPEIYQPFKIHDEISSHLMLQMMFVVFCCQDSHEESGGDDESADDESGEEETSGENTQDENDPSEGASKSDGYTAAAIETPSKRHIAPQITLYRIEEAMASYSLKSKAVFEFLGDHVTISFQGTERASLSLILLIQWLRSGNVPHPDDYQSPN